MNWKKLIDAARQVRDSAYAPYSKFSVGAALEAESGEIFSGCNIENRTFGLTLCAERVAVASAIAAGAGRPMALAVLTSSSPPSPPCGLCLETLTEFASPDLPILLINPAGEQEECKLSDFLPRPFAFDPPLDG